MINSARRWTVCGGWVVKRVVRVETMEFRSAVIPGGTPLETASGGEFSLLLDCMES